MKQHTEDVCGQSSKKLVYIWTGSKICSPTSDVRF